MQGFIISTTQISYALEVLSDCLKYSVSFDIFHRLAVMKWIH